MAGAKSSSRRTLPQLAAVRADPPSLPPPADFTAEMRADWDRLCQVVESQAGLHPADAALIEHACRSAAEARTLADVAESLVAQGDLKGYLKALSAARASRSAYGRSVLSLKGTPAARSLKKSKADKGARAAEAAGGDWSGLL